MPELKPPAPPVVETKIEPFKNRVPAFWSITLVEDGITAINSESGETFAGSIEDFNARLKG
jgi:hypothetical protein